ncbi:MAG: M48 family metallopeptidase [Proteiniphilum sp.]|jgi:predicted Zn-dependent protease|nr:M48 family metallopeptidase [Proteiniphilum sp.]MDD2937436.1 M48 family metallopeptidase [Proteiniphilum sp.]MDD3075219.1 M48 family metallopeptidase [Proteiniphilum sp.]MDD3780009.1 M48 family metallopeptidase [Proteiniphilum sp.]MDD3955170.1 M48 family metallopeptidase [Proteiniphilum sp.]
MKKIISFPSLSMQIMLLFTVLLFESCGSVPFTGRRQLQLVSNQEVIALSLQQYQDFMRTAPLEKGTSNAAMVTRIGTRIANAVETFYTNNGYASELENFSWEFNLVKDKSVNAFAMPGGKVVIYTGLLPVTQTEEALAVVIGHEIAHVIAQHSSERLSQQVALQYGGAIAGGLLGNSQAMQQLGQTVFGLGAQYGVMMPYARKQEYEADEIGLIVMAMAGYNPQVAVPFWTRMAQDGGGAQVPEFLSTHPTDSKRIANIEKIMPAVMQYYKGAGIQNQTSVPIQTKAPVPAETEKAKTSKEWSF